MRQATNLTDEGSTLDWLDSALQQTFGNARPGEQWFGDDAAQLSIETCIVSADVCVAGIHLDVAKFGARAFGWKAVASAISDLAGMGVKPRAMVATVMVPPDTDVAAVFAGMLACGLAHDCPLVGGDLSAASTLASSVTVIGTPWSGIQPVQRRGARPGDAVVVTGPLGAAAAGLRLEGDNEVARKCRQAQAFPVARLVEGRLAASCGASAMMDLSDGLSIDLGRLVDAAGVGFALSEVPVADGATENEALGGGEDYELVITMANPEPLLTRCARLGLRMPSVIGTITADRGQRTYAGKPLVVEGFQHRFEDRR